MNRWSYLIAVAFTLALGAAALALSPLLLPVALAAGLVGFLVAGWKSERERIARWHATPPRRTWAPMRSLEGLAGELDREWQELGYVPLGLLRRDESPDRFDAVYAHPSLPVYGLIDVRPGQAIPSALTFWEGEGTLITTAAPLPEARAAAVDTGTPRLVQLRVGGRPLALDGQHVGTVKAWALGKRTALPATREALIGYLSDDYRQISTTLKHGRAMTFAGYLKALAGRPERILTF
jgi:hypothetical protein